MTESSLDSSTMQNNVTEKQISTTTTRETLPDDELISVLSTQSIIHGTVHEPLLPESEKQSESYLDNIVFAGDSLTYSLGRGTGLLEECDIVSFGGLGVYDFLDFDGEICYNKSYKKLTPLEWLTKLKPKVLYLMLGINGISLFSNQYHINQYNNLLDRIESACPDTKIVIVSVCPIGENKLLLNADNAKIDKFNKYLYETAKTRRLYFLNASEALKSNDGSLDTKYNTGDGIHWSYAGKKAYIDYILSHPIS